MANNIPGSLKNATVNLVTTMATKKLGYAPLTLAHGLSLEVRLLVTVLCTIFGAFTNILYISSFFVERSLHKIGNIFMVCAGLSDLAVTCIIMPIVSLVLISGEGNNNTVCHTLQFLFESVNYAYNMFYALLATERYYCLCLSLDEYDWFISARLRLLCTSVYAISISAAAVGVYFGLDNDYCDREVVGSTGYKQLSLILFCVIPAIITIVRFICAAAGIIAKRRSNVTYRRSGESDIDTSTCVVNITVYAIYVMCWLPYLISTMYLNYEKDDAIFYQCIWFGVVRSAFTTIIYPVFVKNFRSAFVNLLKYCCCKKPLPVVSSRRRRRTTVMYDVTNNEVRIQMLAPEQPTALETDL